MQALTLVNVGEAVCALNNLFWVLDPKEFTDMGCYQNLNSRQFASSWHFQALVLHF